MKFWKGLASLVLIVLLLCTVSIGLFSGLFRFVAANPAYLKTFLPTQSYCDELRARIGENLEHIALLYGLEDNALYEVVTDTDIRVFTEAMIDAFYSAESADSVVLPVYDPSPFREYLAARTALSEQAISDFSEDCAAAVTEDLHAVNLDLVLNLFVSMTHSPVYRFSPILCCSCVLLTVLLLVFLNTMHSRAKNTRRILSWGSLFMGTSIVFVPVMQFLLFDYIGRLNISVSAFRTILSGMLNTVLYGCLVILLVLTVLFLVGLLVSIGLACRRKKPKKTEKYA